MKATLGGTTTVFVGNYYEATGSSIKKYYYAGAARVALRDSSSLYWLLTDHLGSTSRVPNADGTNGPEQRYKAWGEARYTSGTLPTRYGFNGQYFESTIGLYFFNSRWYDPALGRFAQADTIIPGMGNPLAFD